jgi:hypothetical protein
VSRLAATAVTALALAAPVAATAAPATAPYAVEALQVRLYYPQSGTFSPDIPSSASLFNTIIGEGWAREPSTAILVQARVGGQRGSFAAGRRVRLEVRRPSGRLVDRQTAEVGLIGGAGVTRIGFMVQGTGCAKIRVRVTLLGQSPASRRTRDVPFVCGE